MSKKCTKWTIRSVTTFVKIKKETHRHINDEMTFRFLFKYLLFHCVLKRLSFLFGLENAKKKDDCSFFLFPLVKGIKTMTTLECVPTSTHTR